MAVGLPEPHHRAVIDHLQGVTVDGVAVTVTDMPATPPYIAVYAIGGGQVGGDLADLAAPDDDLEFVVQVTCCAFDRRQAQYLQGEVRERLFDQLLAVEGRALFRVRLETPSGVNPDDPIGEQAGQRRWFSTDRFAVVTVPATV